jgi:Skp family chaperone for outer membrane proteins
LLALRERDRLAIAYACESRIVVLHQVEMQRAQAEMQRTQAEMERTQAEMEEEIQRAQAEMQRSQAEMQVEIQRAQAEVQKVQAEMKSARCAQHQLLARRYELELDCLDTTIDTAIAAALQSVLVACNSAEDVEELSECIPPPDMTGKDSDVILSSHLSLLIFARADEWRQSLGY